MRPERAIVAALAVALGACEFQIPAPTYVHQTRLIAVEASVELGPLHPDRVGSPSPAPIAEILPGDRLTLEAVVVNPEGERYDASEIETVWISCGPYDCGASVFSSLDAEYDVPCDALEVYDMDQVCRLGAGDGRFSFEVPPLAEVMLDTRVALYYGVIGYEGRSAEDCWRARMALEEPLERCAFIRRLVKVGPSWWMIAYADQVLGLSASIPLYQIPAGVYAQLANRAPQPRIDVVIDGAIAGTWPDTASYTVAPGAAITVEPSYSPVEQLTQTYFVASLDDVSQTYWFDPVTESIVETPHTTRSLHAVGTFEEGLAWPLDFVIDEYAAPSSETGVSKLFLVYADSRYGEGVAEIVFEVEP